METTVHNHKASIGKILGSKYEVLPEEFTIAEQIGEGQMGVVFKSTLKGKICAAKKLKTGQIVSSQAYNDLIMELDILTMMGNHKNLVEFHGAFVRNTQDPVIFQEFVDGPDLDTYLEKKPPGFNLGRATIFSWSLDILRALDHLHTLNPIIMHRDLKPANILITKDLNTLKLTDFGMAKTLERSERMLVPHKGRTGTRRYMAPEVAASAVGYYTEKSDIFSAAFVIWYILSGSRPNLDIEKNPTSRPDSTPGLQRWKEFTLIVKDMWGQQAEMRPSAGQAISRMLNIPDIPDLSKGAAPKEGCCCLQ